MSLKFKPSARRGDTLIEVMFAIAVFALVAIISIAVMNSGITNAERDLELVTARNELNAQAEALRFIHSSYISEKTLPTSQQQYLNIWNAIIGSAISPAEAEKQGLFKLGELGSCSAVYDVPAGASVSPLRAVKAFVINTRNLTTNVNSSFISTNNPLTSSLFRPTELSSRIIYSNSLGGTSDDQITDGSTGGTLFYQLFDKVSSVEGIWDFVVTDGSSFPKYYDFYIQTCWYGPRANNPTFLDTVIRLYNPENV